MYANVAPFNSNVKFNAKTCFHLNNASQKETENRKKERMNIEK